MPQIEITHTQKLALDRGEDITIKGATQKAYLVVFSTYNVYKVRPPRGEEMRTGEDFEFNSPDHWGICAELIAKGHSHHQPIGHKQAIGGKVLVSKELSR